MAGELGGLLTKKATLLFGIENTVGVNPGLDEDDAIEVQEPEFTVDPSLRERDYVSGDLSPFESLIGRVVAGFSFTTEVRSNGRAQSGLSADEPILSKLFRACGYALTQMDGTNNQSPVIPDPDNPKTSPRVAFANTGDATTVAAPVLYTITVTTAGASTVAGVTVTSNSKDEDAAHGDYIAAPAEQGGVESGVTEIALGAKGGSITMTWAGSLTVGQRWYVAVFPVGLKLMPVSSDFKTASLELFRDGIKMEGNAGLGTFQITAPAGDIARVTFNFTTTFVDPVDAADPVADFGDLPLPSQVELSTLTWGGNRNLMIEQWTFDQANDIQVRPSVNHRQGYFGSRIAGRAPVIGFNPEATHESDHPFWAEFLGAKSKTFITRVGTEVGNQVVFFGGKAQTSEQSFGDRNGLLTYEKSAMLKRINGNDEMIIVFC
jgi:hypothetical protein